MRVFATDCKRAFCSVGFWVGSLGLAVAGFLGAFEFMTAGLNGLLAEDYGSRSLQTAYTAISSDLFVLVLPIVCTLAYSAAFVEEFKSKYIRASLPRAGRRKYLASKVAATALSGGAAVLLGALLLLAAYTILFPPTQGIERNELALTYVDFFKRALLAFLSGGLWALMGGVFTTATKNKYMAYACPFIFYYVLVTFQDRYYKGLYFLSPQEWLKAEHISFVLTFVVVIALVAAAGLAYALLMRRRLRDV